VKTTDIGEFGLIERLAALLPKGAPPELVAGIGDDTAVWRVGERCLLATTDTMVEDEHFDELAEWPDVGWKILAVNLSDIAAMGGTPLFGLVTIGVRPKMRVEALDALYTGLAECAERYGVAIVGGDVVRARQVSVTVALLGEARMAGRRPLVLRRGGAKVGDAIAVTGTLGDSAGGLRQMQQGEAPDKRLRRRHYRPEPRLAEGQAAVRAGLRCAIDVSDGLLQDLGHVCEQSGVGAVVRWEDVPVSKELLAAYPRKAAEMALTGGEDYELVLVGRRAVLSRLPVTIIGETVEGSGVRVLDLDGAEVEFASPGWDALRL
jgi:thiamine-monophosphate kinase